MTEKERTKLLQQLLEKQKAGTLKAADRYEIPSQDMPSQDWQPVIPKLRPGWKRCAVWGAKMSPVSRAVLWK
jgi:hypothetical protein